jgi:hypothetical protein
MNMEQRWDYIDRKTEGLEKIMCEFHSVVYKSHRTDLGLNPGHHSEKLAADRLSYGMASFIKYIMSQIAPCILNLGTGCRLLVIFTTW